MRVRRALGLGLAALFVLVSAPEAVAGAATDQLKGAIDRVVATLDSPALKGDGKVLERRTAVRKIANEIFDFNEIARRSLGRYWQPLTEPQRTEFVFLFGDLLERSYISKIELYGGEKIVYSGERVEADLATVSTRIMTKNGTEVPVDYRLFKRGDRWMIYDVSVEGISLVSNYRTQFNKIIQTNGYNGLVEKMRTKQTEFAGEEAQRKMKN
ncbi:MAG TPA: ABC transporter substrate-binding protein [Methylomirabilota bacterium]|jgi:phospholipid transport system substrate-binding protein|nr:ABC transporter substrate-binding protein [Methylomirabilota bacterium]